MSWAARSGEERRDEIVAYALARALSYHEESAIVPYLDSGLMSADEMIKKIRKIKPGRASAFD